MPGGSTTREDPTDQQCEHCTLWFSSQGIGTHEPNCVLKDMPLEVVPADDEQLESSLSDETSTSESPPSPDGVEVDSRESPPSSPVPSDVATDGGQVGLGLDGPPGDRADRDVDDVDRCPDCRCEHWYDIEEAAEFYPDDVVTEFDRQCTACGEVWQI